MKPPELILASTSPYRRALLDRLGIEYRAVVPEVDEDSFKASIANPRALAESLAIAKAEGVSRRWPDAVVIGSDQVAAIDGRALGKPGDQATAAEQLLQMQGRDHELITAMAVCRGDWQATHVDVTRLTMRALNPDEITRYVAADRPLDCAGSYKLESRGIALFERIDSADHTAIIGLPLIALTTILKGLGFGVP